MTTQEFIHGAVNFKHIKNGDYLECLNGIDGFRMFLLKNIKSIPAETASMLSMIFYATAITIITKLVSPITESFLGNYSNIITFSALTGSVLLFEAKRAIDYDKKKQKLIKEKCAKKIRLLKEYAKEHLPGLDLEKDLPIIHLSILETEDEAEQYELKHNFPMTTFTQNFKTVRKIKNKLKERGA